VGEWRDKRRLPRDHTGQRLKLVERGFWGQMFFLSPTISVKELKGTHKAVAWRHRFYIHNQPSEKGHCCLYDSMSSLGCDASIRKQVHKKHTKKHSNQFVSDQSFFTRVTLECAWGELGISDEGFSQARLPNQQCQNTEASLTTAGISWHTLHYTINKLTVINLSAQQYLLLNRSNCYIKNKPSMLSTI